MPCLACDLVDGRVPLPGGQLHRTTGWLVEHCVGPLGLGSLIVEPERHVVSVADLDDDEATELGRGHTPVRCPATSTTSSNP